jgi:nicotinamidase-related amidase
VIDMQTVLKAEDEIFANENGRAAIVPIIGLASPARCGRRVIWTRQTVSDEMHWPCLPGNTKCRSQPSPAGWQTSARACRRTRLSRRLPASTAIRFCVDIILHHVRPRLCPGTGVVKSGIRLIVLAGPLTNVCAPSARRPAKVGGELIILSYSCSAVMDGKHNAALSDVRPVFAIVRHSNETLVILAKG